jgi:hypothetical protein
MRARPEHSNQSTEPRIPEVSERRETGLAIALVVAAAFFIENLDGLGFRVAFPWEGLDSSVMIGLVAATPDSTCSIASMNLRSIPTGASCAGVMG